MEDQPMSAILRNFFEDESGATAIEYGLIAALIAVAIIAALTALGTELNDLFVAITERLSAVQVPAAP